MPAVRSKTPEPHRWQLSAWVLGGPEFVKAAHQYLQDQMEQTTKRASRYRDMCGDVTRVPALQVDPLLVFSGIGVEVVRGHSLSGWGSAATKDLSFGSVDLKGIPGWEPGFSIVVAAWVGFPFAANAMDVSPSAHMVMASSSPENPFNFIRLSFWEAFCGAMQCTAKQAVRRHSGELMGEADECAYQALLPLVLDQAQLPMLFNDQTTPSLFSLARERTLASGIPAASPTPRPKPRF